MNTKEFLDTRYICLMSARHNFPPIGEVRQMFGRMSVEGNIFSWKFVEVL